MTKHDLFELERVVRRHVETSTPLYPGRVMGQIHAALVDYKADAYGPGRFIGHLADLANAEFISMDMYERMAAKLRSLHAEGTAKW